MGITTYPNYIYFCGRVTGLSPVSCEVELNANGIPQGRRGLKPGGAVECGDGSIWIHIHPIHGT